MKKRSSKGKGYFYSMGQRDNRNGVLLSGPVLRDRRKKLKPWARDAWEDGYYGYYGY